MSFIKRKPNLQDIKWIYTEEFVMGLEIIFGCPVRT